MINSFKQYISNLHEFSAKKGGSSKDLAAWTSKLNSWIAIQQARFAAGRNDEKEDKGRFGARGYSAEDRPVKKQKRRPGDS